MVTITGVNIHPSIAKGRMVNAIRLAGLFLDRLPRAALSRRKRRPTARGSSIRTASRAASPRRRFDFLLRDFDTREAGRSRRSCSAPIARTIEAEYPAREDRRRGDAKQYRNMADGLAKEPRAVEFADEAMRRAGLEPKILSIRGGTDGSRLTEMGLPTPNLSTGEHNPHSPLEWTCLDICGHYVGNNIR